MTRIALLISSFIIYVLSASACHTTHAAADSTATDSLAAEQLLADSLNREDAALAQQSLPERLAQLLDNEIFERTQVGLYVFDLTADTVVYAHNPRQCLRPASNEKVMTAVTALRTLGTDYKFRTRLYATSVPADTDSVFAGCVYIKGGYDPLTDDADLCAFADTLLARGIKCITSPVALDLTMKNDDRLGWGWCWDDNEVPLTPLLYENTNNFVHQLRRTLRARGIEWDGTTTEGTVPSNALLLTERTHTIDDVLRPMMKRSDNSMAEAVFYQLAAHNGTPRAGRKQAVAHYNDLIKELGLTPSHYQIADGSGLSLYNYLTPELLMQTLRYAYQHKDIYNHLLPTLPVAGVDGSLRKRMRGTAAMGNVCAKTGTVEGVSTLSGYCTAANGNRLCFSIMNQGIRYTSTGRNFQDRVCRALCK